MVNWNRLNCNQPSLSPLSRTNARDPSLVDPDSQQANCRGINHAATPCRAVLSSRSDLRNSASRRSRRTNERNDRNERRRERKRELVRSMSSAWEVHIYEPVITLDLRRRASSGWTTEWFHSIFLWNNVGRGSVLVRRGAARSLGR